MLGWPPGRRGICTGSLPPGCDPAGEHAGDRRAALLARHERLHEAGGAARDVAERVRPAGDDDDDDRRAGGEQRVEQLGLDARQPQVLGVAALAGGAAAEQAGQVADERDAHVRVAGRVDRGRRSRSGPSPLHGAARLVHDLDVGQLGAQGVERARAPRCRARAPGWRGSTWLGKA